MIAASLLITILMLRFSRDAPQNNRNLIGTAREPVEAEQFETEPYVAEPMTLLPPPPEVADSREEPVYLATQDAGFETVNLEPSFDFIDSPPVSTAIALPMDVHGEPVPVLVQPPNPDAGRVAFIPSAELEQESSIAAQVSQESILEPMLELEQSVSNEPAITIVDNLPEPGPEPELKPDPLASGGDFRIATKPQPKDKPKFKKFGAVSKKKSDEDDDDEEDEDDDDDDSSAKKSVSLSSTNRFKLAATPKKGDRYKDDTPLTDSHSHFIPGAHGNFSATPTLQEIPYDPWTEINIYQGKQLNANQRPLLELGRPWYQLGPISEGSSILGFHNNVNPQYVLFGDARSAIASNRTGGDSTTLAASQLNLFHHLKFTSTERIVAAMSPLSQGANNTRYVFDDDEFEFEGNANFNFAYFEGDVGALVGGAIGKTLPFDLPFAAGIIPLVFQNGIWMEDEILGVAVTIPARNSARFDISNMDITFFAGYDRLDSPAFDGDDSAARIIGVASFFDALNGYFEIDYAFLDDRTNLDRSYHNFGFGYTRRYGRFISNSTRIIVNAGQQNGVPGTADGVLLLSENSLITRFPQTVVPYLNMFAGFDQPQSAGRNAAAGGILRNTGILFESDNLTGYPTLDATANDTFGLALGVNLLADEFAQQFIIEAAALGVIGDNPDRNALGDQYGLGVRYQLPLSNSVIFRADAMVGFLRNDEDINGGRMEIRKKF